MTATARDGDAAAALPTLPADPELRRLGPKIMRMSPGIGTTSKVRTL